MSSYRVVTLVLLLGLWITPARAQAQVTAPACSWLWSAEGRLDWRKQLVSDCEAQPLEFLQTLTEMARRGDWQASFLWYFRSRFGSSLRVHDDVSTSVTRPPVGGTECTPLLDVLSSAPGDASALRRVRLLGAADKCFQNQAAAPKSHYFVSISAVDGDEAWILRDADQQPSILKAVTPTRGPGSSRLFLAVVPFPSGAVIWVTPNGKSAETRPLTFRVDGRSTPELSDRHIDSLGVRRKLALGVEFDSCRQVAYLDGQPLPLDCARGGRQTTHVTVHSQPGANSLVVLETLPDSVRGGQMPYAKIRVSLPLESSPFSYQINLRSRDQKVGILPIVPEECHEHGIVESSVRLRIRNFLSSHGVAVGELGLLAEVARKYSSTVTSITELSGASRSWSRGPNDNRERFGSEAKTLLAEGFADLLDFRVSCTRSPRGDALFSFTAVRIYLERMAREEAEGYSDVAHAPPLFQSSSHVVSDPQALREGVVFPIAELWEKPSLELVGTSEKVLLHDDVLVKSITRSPAPSQPPPRLRGWIQHLGPVGSGQCKAIRAANELQDPATLTLLTGSEFEGVPPDHRSFLPKGSLVRGGDYQVVLAPDDPSMKPGTGAWWDRAAFRCVEVVEPWAEAGADYYFGEIWRLNPELLARPESAHDRFLIARIGTASGFSASFGYWRTRREGITPASWMDTPRLGNISPDGRVPYVYDTRSVLFGFSYGRRVCVQCLIHPLWHRRLPVEWRVYLMSRLEWKTGNGMPSELEDFGEYSTGDRSLTLDVTAGAALSAGVQLSRNALFRFASLSVFVPRLGHALSVINPFIDETARRSVWWDPTGLVVMYGIGGSYQWD